MSFSQLNQDLHVLSFYNNKYNGFFVEIGANDGITLSNTYLLEQKYNWTGICAEPIPKKFELLCVNRPKSHCCNSAVYNESNKNIFFDIANNCDLLSGISEHIDVHANTVNENKTQFLVNTITLNDLLDKYNSPLCIDYLSLDTEGSEYEILKSVNFEKYTFGIIDVEHNFVEPKRTLIKKLLLNNGYEYVGENKWDDCYRFDNFNKIFSDNIL
jgi:FkbM family methyltransferase